MTTKRINLQNTPTLEGVISKSVAFQRDGLELKGTLYLPDNFEGPLPGVVVAGAWTSVKEQMAGTYARELASQGFAALAFDFTGWGESQGSTRYCEDPVAKTADIRAATGFMTSLPEVDASRIYGLGICASAGYMAAAVADDQRLSRLALVAPWLHDREMVEGIYGGEENVNKLIDQGKAAALSETPELIPAASATDERALMFQAPYYSETDRGLISSYDNQFCLASWESWLTYDAQASADRLSAPTLVVCSEAAALPAGVHAYMKRTKAPVEEVWMNDISQFDFYDRLDVVKTAVEEIAEHLNG